MADLKSVAGLFGMTVSELEQWRYYEEEEQRKL